MTADESITKAIELLPQEPSFPQAQKFRERGEIKFKKGEIIEAEKDFNKSEEIFKELAHRAQETKGQINRQFFLSFLTLICGKGSWGDLQK